jgi:tetratricopeptide (TPR) repeat protein
MNRHLWIAGSGLAGRTGVAVDCHRRLRGPYTGVGSLLRILVPQLVECQDDLTAAHPTEIVTIAPELGGLVGATPQMVTELAGQDERIRMDGRARTTRLAHGVTDFVLAWAARCQPGPPVLSFSRADEADPTDQEFLSILLRRAPRRQLSVVVAAGSGNITGELAAALHAHARRTGGAPAERHGSQRDPLHAYIAGDGTSADPAEIAAYTGAEPAERAALHDERAAHLERTGDQSLRLGAIPYHLEHGSDRSAAIQALREALGRCMSRSYYRAGADFGQRGRAISDPRDGLDYWYFTNQAGLAHTALGEIGAAETLYLEVLRHCANPYVRMAANYGMAMLCTRFRTPGDRDHGLAREHINNAIAIVSLDPDTAKRPLRTVFNVNGLALVEMNSGDPARALQLVTDSLETLSNQPPDRAQVTMRAVLMNNAAQILARTGRPGEAVTRYGAAIELDPGYPEYYFARAAVLRQLGRPAEALKDYDTAVSVSLPFWELHHNRAAVRAELGDLGGAIADFERVTDLEPGQLDPWVSLVSLLLEAGDLAGARIRIGQGLRIHPGDPQLLCVRAQLWMAQGQAGRAGQDFDAALAADSRLIAALAGRADLAYQAGHHRAAIDDLTRAIEIAGDDPDLLYNRALSYQASGGWQAAIDDCTRALALPGADREELLSQRDQCHARLGADA